MTDEKENGLHLLHRNIQKINGPVSMYYLKPRPHVWNRYKKEGIELPLLLLWGDIHEHRSGMCENCSCDTENESKKNCCMALHDERFLKEMDELAKVTPIDFYTEFSKDMMENVEYADDILFGDFIKKTTKHCHDVKLRSIHSYEKLCPTRNIRWHYVDSRFMKDMIEGYMIQPIRKWVLFHMKHLSKPSSKPLTLGDVLEQYGEYDPDHETEFQTYSLPRNRELLSIFFESDDIETATVSFCNMVLDSISVYRPKRKSAIFKQLDRISFLKMADVELWKHWMISNLLGMPLYRDAFQEVQELSEEVRATLKQMILTHMTYDFSVDGWNHPPSYAPLLPALKRLYKLLLIAQTKIMDLYFVGRLLKTPQENITGTLALGFFGDYHTRSIVDFLSQPIFGYDVLTVQSTDLVEYNDPRIKRCVTIDMPIPLVQDVMAHHQRRFPTPNQQWQVERYYRKLQNEQKQRNMNKMKTNTAKKTVKTNMNMFSFMSLGKKGGGQGRRRKTRSKKRNGGG